jgi:hypothetical protein
VLEANEVASELADETSSGSFPRNSRSRGCFVGDRERLEISNRVRSNKSPMKKTGSRRLPRPSEDHGDSPPDKEERKRPDPKLTRGVDPDTGEDVKKGIMTSAELKENAMMQLNSQSISQFDHSTIKVFSHT